MKKKIPNIILEGEKFIVKSFEKKYVSKQYLSWMNDKKITQYLHNPQIKYSLNDLKKYYANSDFNKKILFAVIDKKKNKHIGNMTLNPIDIKNKKAGLGGIIGDKRYWGSTAFVDSLKLLIDYAFNKRDFIRIESSVNENNVACIIASKKAGFKLEGIKKKDIIINNKLVCDTYIFGIINKKK